MALWLYTVYGREPNAIAASSRRGECLWLYSSTGAYPDLPSHWAFLRCSANKALHYQRVHRKFTKFTGFTRFTRKPGELPLLLETPDFPPQLIRGAPALLGVWIIALSLSGLMSESRMDAQGYCELRRSVISGEGVAGWCKRSEPRAWKVTVSLAGGGRVTDVGLMGVAAHEDDGAGERAEGQSSCRGGEAKPAMLPELLFPPCAWRRLWCGSRHRRNDWLRPESEESRGRMCWARVPDKVNRPTPVGRFSAGPSQGYEGECPLCVGVGGG
ncbi:hypothetical protein B0H14DRAFT_2647705 [Mycena olivaceomarginata]|nr:hypothetical protein B0H14DRAFT_2647705 [Mycena olivaceomarginata]